ncbi:TPA: hypothetical protein OXB05_002699 [Clostridioides difficile]|uniref:HipA family kinase n=1 Tax=Clostridioides difficile TaxID=1496 RepID=UPI00097FE684|nr:HipA family kinase [Clostridioides difficile]EGT3817429.1 hypothetical protein [Clostridioides difficile]EGT3828372.1 hypothetical protein [Clostridioides difficile]EGT4890988.1 hypothetical protein [Clostridioides difficile]EKS6800479.1 hypothetical protein [Clostridioides difficile]EKS7167071.1 hypothetical protein [Clostridioides difficile]
MDIQYIEELRHPMGNGATNPIFGIGDNRQYVIKTNNNIQGNKVLINELVCYLLAQRLELPIPTAKLCKIDNNTKIDSNIYNIIEDFSSNCYGIGFCSEYINNVTLISSHKMLKLASNQEYLIPKLMLFDHIIYNNDRNKGNLLLRMGKTGNRELMMIDHSHTFNLGSIWDSCQLKQKIQSEDYKDEYIMCDNSYLYSMFKKSMDINMIVMNNAANFFKSKLCNNLDFLIEKIPNSWENDINELKSLLDYINYRINHIDYFANMIASYKY